MYVTFKEKQKNINANAQAHEVGNKKQHNTLRHNLN